MKARNHYVVDALKNFPWQEQTGEVTFRKKSAPVQFWCRLSEETEAYHDGQNRTRTVDHISVEIFEDSPIVVNGITVGGSLRFQKINGSLYFRGYATLRRVNPDGSYILGGDSLPSATHKSVRDALESVAARLFEDHEWLTRERMVLRLQEMERAAGKVEEAREELAKLEIVHRKAADAAADAVTLVRSFR